MFLLWPNPKLCGRSSIDVTTAGRKLIWASCKGKINRSPVSFACRMFSSFCLVDFLLLLRRSHSSPAANPLLAESSHLSRSTRLPLPARRKWFHTSPSSAALPVEDSQLGLTRRMRYVGFDGARMLSPTRFHLADVLHLILYTSVVARLRHFLCVKRRVSCHTHHLTRFC